MKNLTKEIATITKKIDTLKQLRREKIEILYGQKLQQLVEVENQRMRRNMSVFYDDPEDHVSQSARGKQDEIVFAIKKLGVATCHEISLRTGISNRSVQAAIGDLVRKKRVVRMPVKSGEQKSYCLPKIKKRG